MAYPWLSYLVIRVCIHGVLMRGLTNRRTRSERHGLMVSFYVSFYASFYVSFYVSFLLSLFFSITACLHVSTGTIGEFLSLLSSFVVMFSGSCVYFVYSAFTLIPYRYPVPFRSVPFFSLLGLINNDDPVFWIVDMAFIMVCMCVVYLLALNFEF